MKPKLLSVTASELVILAVHELESMKLHNLGPTFKDILELILNKYKVNNQELKADVREALLRGVTFGIFNEQDGRYRLEDVPDPPLDLNTSKSKDSWKNAQATSTTYALSNTTRKRKSEGRSRESETKTLFKRKRNNRGTSEESKSSNIKSESESESKATDAEEDENSY